MPKQTKNNIFTKRLCLSEDELIRYSSGEMTEKDKHEVERHLPDCELCSEALDGLSLMKDPADYAVHKSKILLSLENAMLPGKAKQTKGYWLAAAAVIAVFVLSGIYFQFIQKTEKLTNGLADLPEHQNNNVSIASSVTDTQDSKTSVMKEETRADTNTPVSVNDSIGKSAKNLTVTDNQTYRFSASGSKENSDEPEEVVNTVASDDLKEKEAVSESNMVTTGEKPVLAETAASFDKDESKSVSKREVTMVSPLEEKADNIPATTGAAEINLNKNKSYKDADEAGLSSQEVINLIEKEKYKEALSESKKLLVNYPGNVEVNYYTGLSYYYLNQPMDAIHYFDNVIYAHDTKYFEDARWHKALSYLKMNDKINTRKVLSQIISEKSSYRQKAERMLEQIDGN